MFADDTFLFGETARNLQENLVRFSRAISVYGLMLNEAKCTVVHIKQRRKTKAWYAAMRPIIFSAQNRISYYYILILIQQKDSDTWD